jgi:tRNA 2-thiouridine synthesizing protein A
MIIKNVKIDLLGLKCPLPVLKANKLIKEHKKGDIIELLVDDIAAPNDFKIYCETKNYKLLSIKESKHITIKIEI